MIHLTIDYDIEGIPGYIEAKQVDILPDGVWSSDRVSIIVEDNFIKMYYTHKQEPDEKDRAWAEWILTGRYLTPYTKPMQDIIDRVIKEWDSVFPRLKTISENDSPLILDFVWNEYRKLYIDKE